MEKDYIYPDIDDKITKAFIKENEPFPSYWEKSEENVLKLIKEKTRKHLSRSKDSWLLDAGCGTGRLLPEFQRYFSNILAIDPDPLQIDKAKKIAKNKGFIEKVVFKVTSAEQLDWKEESVDVILSSHIIQHVNTETIPRILCKFHKVLKSDGLLFIMTTHSRKSLPARPRRWSAKAIFYGHSRPAEHRQISLPLLRLLGKKAPALLRLQEEKAASWSVSRIFTFAPTPSQRLAARRFISLLII